MYAMNRMGFHHNNIFWRGRGRREGGERGRVQVAAMRWRPPQQHHLPLLVVALLVLATCCCLVESVYIYRDKEDYAYLTFTERGIIQNIVKVCSLLLLLLFITLITTPSYLNILSVILKINQNVWLIPQY